MVQTIKTHIMIKTQSDVFKLNKNSGKTSKKTDKENQNQSIYSTA